MTPGKVRSLKYSYGVWLGPRCHLPTRIQFCQMMLDGVDRCIVPLCRCEFHGLFEIRDCLCGEPPGACVLFRGGRSLAFCLAGRCRCKLVFQTERVAGITLLIQSQHFSDGFRARVGRLCHRTGLSMWFVFTTENYHLRSLCAECRDKTLPPVVNQV